MAKKRKAFVHVGMPGVGDVIESAIVHHRDALVELGVDVPAKTGQQAFRAAVEITRDHQAWGLRRKDVEGSWADLCRRVQRGRHAVVVSQPLLAVATRPQIELLLDGLAGFEVHVVVTATAPHAWSLPGEPESDLGVVLDRWGGAMRRPERLHVLLVETDPDQPAATRRASWQGFGALVGFGTASLGLADVPEPVAARPAWLVPGVPRARVGVLEAMARAWIDRLESGGYSVIGDPGQVLGKRLPVVVGDARVGDLDRALQGALREIELLARRNEGLEGELAAVDKKRRKLKKKLREVA